MKIGSKQKGMTREQAAELYKDLQKTLGSMKDDAKAKANAPKNSRYVSAARAKLNSEMTRLNPLRSFSIPANGQNLALSLIFAMGLIKIGIAIVEYSGVTTAQNAQAAQSMEMKPNFSSMIQAGSFSREEIEILTQLDQRRAELEERDDKLSMREEDISKRDMELAARLTELKSLTDELKVRREQTDHKRDNQLEQLSKVYTSMAPEEAAKLMEQLDITIALSLLRRMPEKRIGQVLSLMSPERALGLTQMLTQ